MNFFPVAMLNVTKHTEGHTIISKARENKMGYRDFKAFNFEMSSQIIVFLDMSRQPY